jgi:putative DNA methylase
MKIKKKLIEVALPLEAINKASVRESYIYRGNPSAMHKWWAQRPLAAARAVIFAQMVDDPSSHPDLFPTGKKQEKERQRLFKIIEDLVQWENTNNEMVVQRARDEIWQSWRYACAEHADHPRAKELFNRNRLPAFDDPFAGSGALPLEAQRLGLECHASDLNPVAVLICKAMIEIPPKFAGRPPSNPEVRSKRDLVGRTWQGAEGLAEDVRYYGQWMRDQAEKRIGKLYPKVEITTEMVRERPDLKPLVGQKLTVIAWLWVRTVKSPNPAFRQVDVPLASTFMLSSKGGKEAYVEPVLESGSYRFRVKVGKPRNAESTKGGTKLSRGANFQCLMSGTPIEGDYIKAEGQAGRMGMRMMAIAADSDLGRIYLAPIQEHLEVARKAKPEWKPEVEFFQHALGFRVGNYGMTNWSDLFTPRQLVALSTFADLVQEAREQVQRDVVSGGLPDDGRALREGGIGATAYADSVAIYLAFALSKTADYNCALVPWYTKEDRPGHLFSKQAIPMVWDFTELNPLCTVGGAFGPSSKIVADSLTGCPPRGLPGRASQSDAVTHQMDAAAVCSTDPPYYDNVGYADLSDFFYVWLRRSIRTVFPDLFATLAAPKAAELVATPGRHGGMEGAEKFFLEGMKKAMHLLAERAHPAFPVTIYYAFKQSESGTEEGPRSTGWETFLDAVICAGFAIGGTWPMRTERQTRSRGIGSNALASSIVLVCRKCLVSAPTATRREFITALKAELPGALAYLQRGNIAPVDLAQAAIGPGMAVYTRYSRVLDADGTRLSVREALALINQTLDEALAEQEGDFDSESRWALTWFEQSGFVEGEYGLAEQLSKSKNTSVAGMADAHILESKRGKVRLLRPKELPADWDPTNDPRLTAWEIVHQLIRALESGGEGAAARLVASLGAKAEVARELCYRLYTLSERKKRATEALGYNGLVQSWPEITRLAREGGLPKARATGDMFEQE